MDIKYEDKIAFGQRLERFLKTRNVTQDEVAAQTKLTRQTINNIINGKSNASSEFLLRFASLYHELNFNWLITGRGQMVAGGDTKTQHDPRQDYSPKNLIELLDEKDKRIDALQKVITSNEQTVESQKEIIELQRRIIDQYK